MNEINYENFRREALNFDKSIYKRIILDKARMAPYFDTFLSTFIESYNCYIKGFYKASIVLASEALLRLLCSKLHIVLMESKAIWYRAARNSRRRLELDEDGDYYGLLEKLTYRDIIEICISKSIIKRSLKQTVCNIKDLRNIVIHKDIPVIDQWDPMKGKRDENAIIKILNGEEEIPEGYRIFLKNRQITFDCSKGGYCFQKLSPEARISAIQLLMVMDILNELFQDN